METETILLMPPFRLTLDITPKRIADMLCAALEGGSNYWIEGITAKPGTAKANPWGAGEYTPDYIEAPFSGHVQIKASVKDAGTLYTLNSLRLQRGMEIMAQKYPAAFAEFQAEQDDANTADLFLQCCLFDEVVFG